MNNKIISIIIIGLITIVAIVAAIRLLSGPEDGWLCQGGFWVKHGQPQEPMPSVVCGQQPTAGTTTSEQATTTQASEGPNGELKTANGHLEVTSPQKGQEVELPFKIKGQSVTFEGNVPFKIKEKDGKILMASCLMGGAYEMKPFSKTIDYFFQKPATSDIVLELYDDNPKGEGETQFVSIPLTLTKQGWVTVKLFFSDNNNRTSDCSQVVPIELAAPRSGTPAKRALELLLEGVPCGINLTQESYQGLTSNIARGTELQSLTVDDNGVARADFNEKLQNGIAGSCNMTAIKAQITETLKQFPTIKEVIITTNGQVL